MRDQIDEHGPVQSRAGGVAAVHGFAAAGAAVDGVLGHVWAGIVGRDGIKPDVFYRLDENGKPQEVEVA